MPQRLILYVLRTYRSVVSKTYENNIKSLLRYKGKNAYRFVNGCLAEEKLFKLNGGLLDWWTSTLNTFVT